MKKFFIFALIIASSAVIWRYRNQIEYISRSIIPDESSALQGKLVEDLSGQNMQIVAEGLEVPWELAFLPDGDILVTERPGRLKRVGKNGQIYEISGVVSVGEGGLLGMALHPDFEENNFLYLYMTTDEGGHLSNRVDRYIYKDDALKNKTTIVQGIPGSRFHDGGRIEFGPDKMLYITTGDAQQSFLAQDRNSLAGKVLRIGFDGTIPLSNPFGTAVWSYGHRNPQGITWDSQGRMWITEHGRSGLLSGLDELNIVEGGKNYGWPSIQGDESSEGMVSPEAHSGSKVTWAPAGAVSLKKSIFFAGLKGEALYEYNYEDKSTRIHFQNQFGRIRAVVKGPDGFLYLTTSNTDGRGRKQTGDDKIIKIDPEIFR